MVFIGKVPNSNPNSRLRIFYLIIDCVPFESYLQSLVITIVVSYDNKNEEKYRPFDDE